MSKIIILGAGISGISGGFHFKKSGIKSTIYEKNNSWGGLCDNFSVNGFRFDKFIHLSFSKSEYVKSLFAKSTDYIIHKPDPVNYYKGHCLKHPAQNNLFELKVQEKVKIITDFIQRDDKELINIKNYEEWLRFQYGDYFAENFPMKYTQKYWTVPAKELGIKWVGKRMYKPSIEEVLEGAMSSVTPNTYYAKEMRYPQKGGYKSFLSGMVENLSIQLNKEVINIDPSNKEIKFSDGSIELYDSLLSSLPLPEICKMINNIPEKVLKASRKLKYTSGVLISLGFNTSDIPKNLWSYIYDEDILTSRIYSPSLKSRDNVPEGCSSLQAELYYSEDKPLEKELDVVLDEEVIKFTKMGLFDKEDLVVKDIRIEKYANIIFNHDIYENRKIVHDYLDSIGIKYIGRFGEWAYLWSDQSLLTGKNIVNELL